MILLLAPGPLQTFVVQSGNIYQSDVNSIIYFYNSTLTTDLTNLQSSGCAVLNTVTNTSYLGKLIGANFNTTADQLVLLNIPSTYTYRVNKVTVENASISLSAAVGGIYTATAKSGSAIVAATQSYSANTASNVANNLTLALPNLVIPAGTQLYLSLSTAQGSAATANLYVYGDVYN